MAAFVSLGLTLSFFYRTVSTEGISSARKSLRCADPLLIGMMASMARIISFDTVAPWKCAAPQQADLLRTSVNNIELPHIIQKRRITEP